MMSGSRGQEAGVLEGLMTLVSDPTAFAARIAELQEHQAKIAAMSDDLAAQRIGIEARAAALQRKDDELCKVVTSIAESERALAEREEALAKHEADVDAKQAKLEQSRINRDKKAAEDKAALAGERKALKQVAEVNAATENGLKVRAAALDDREAKLAEDEDAAQALIVDYTARLAALKKLVAAEEA
ncbi:hypothetical protein ACHMW7_16140 [Aminobacter sp. UC22_36]|uniref:hypothetical protein n=1 Tax=Aminobacter sp. UC22_36 TaxID=3374549 RepID=UPI003756CAAA